MDIGLLQYAPGYLCVDENLDAVATLIEGVDVDLLVLPELFATGYYFASTEDAQTVAEAVPEGPTCQHLEQWASESGATIVAGLVERSDEGELFNSAVVMAPSGLVGTYRKAHLYYEEKLHFQPGDSGFHVFACRTRAGASYTLGVMICFDWYYPEAARTLATQGADLIAHPSNLVRPDCPRSMPIRALENRVFTVTANRIGREENERGALRFIGQSLLCDPDGAVLASASDAETTLLQASIDVSCARDKQLTPHNDLLADRRPSLYA